MEKLMGGSVWSAALCLFCWFVPHNMAASNWNKPPVNQMLSESAVCGCCGTCVATLTCASSKCPCSCTCNGIFIVCSMRDQSMPLKLPHQVE